MAMPTSPSPTAGSMRVIGAERLRQRAAVRKRIDRDHAGGAGEACELDSHQPDGAEPEHRDAVAELDFGVADRQGHHNWIKAHGRFVREPIRHEIGLGLIDRLGFADREMSEDTITDAKPGDGCAGLADHTNRHVAQRPRERVEAFGGVARQDGSHGVVVRAVGDRVISVRHQLRPMFRGGKLGPNPDLVRTEGLLVVLAYGRSSRSSGDKFSWHGFPFL